MKRLNLTKVSLAIITFPIFWVVISPNSTFAAAPVVNQGSTTNFAVLGSSTVTNTGATTMSGTAGADIGLSPGTSFTGSGTVTTSGVQHITDTTASAAQTDLVTAYNDLGIPTPTTLTNPDLATQVISPGTYNTAAGTFSNSGNLTLDAGGDANAIFIFQAASTVITSTSSTMTLANGAQACHVFWQVGSSATLGVTSTFVGHIYAMTSITANTGASVKGQLLARTGAVTLDGNTIVNDSCVTATPTPTPVVTATPTPTPVVTATPTPTPVVTPTPTPTPVVTPTPTPVVTPTPTPVVTPTPTPVVTPTPTPVVTPTPPPPTTITSGALPKTGSPWYNLLALSAGLVLLGGFGVFSRKRTRN